MLSAQTVYAVVSEWMRILSMDVLMSTGKMDVLMLCQFFEGLPKSKVISAFFIVITFDG